MTGGEKEKHLPTAVLVPDGTDQGAVWHYGDPLGEQRRMMAGYGVVILPAEFPVTIAYPDFDPARQCLAWLGKNEHPRHISLTRTVAPTFGRGEHVLLLPDQVPSLLAQCEPIGLWAYEALRIAARQVRLGLDTDQATTWEELGVGKAPPKRWFGLVPVADAKSDALPVAGFSAGGGVASPAPSRRLRLVHLDGSAAEPLPPLGTVLTYQGQPAGRLGTTAQHYELGPIGLALVSTDVPAGATVLAGETPAVVAAD